VTYPQQPSYPVAPGYPPQGYMPAGPQPQYGAPQGTPWMPQQYGGAPAPQLGGQMPPTAAPALGESGRTGGGPKAPAPRHLVGRTVILEPIRIDETTKQKNDKTGEMELRPTAYYNLTVVDGGPLQYGDNKSNDPRQQHGMTMETQVPARFLNVSSDRFGIVNEVRDTMARGDAASVGVMVQGTRGNFPFLMTKCSRDLDGNERPDGDQRFQAATQVWNAIFAKTFQSPEPRSLVAAPPVQPPQVQYQQQAPAGYAQQQYAQTGTVPTPYAAAPAGQLHPEYVAAATQPAYNPGPAPQHYPVPGGTAADWAASPYQPQQAPQSQVQQFAHGGYMPEQLQTGAYNPPQQSAPPTPPSAQQGYGQNPAFEAWLATLPPEQQAAQRAALAGQPTTQPQQPGGPGF
jgi:hypothetical protein